MIGDPGDYMETEFDGYSIEHGYLVVGPSVRLL
jgi:hypothetical protein